MNIDLKNSLVMALVGAAITSAGFLAKDHFDAEKKKEKFVFELHKKLYDDGAASIKNVNKAYSKLFGLYGESYGLTPAELSEKHEAFKNALEKYSDYIDELERYGTTNQVAVAKNHIDWLWGIYAELDLQLKKSRRVLNRAKELLLIEDVDSDLFKFVSEALDSEVEQLVRNENRIYYTIGWFKKPVVNGIEQYLNYQFRDALGIQATNDMLNAINTIPQLSDKSNNFKFKEKLLPFMFAEGRAFQAPTLEYEGDLSFFKDKNAVLAQNLKLKFIAAAIENDQNLQDTLKERKFSAEKN
ncbi:hypothetical protein CWB96_13465 [Pseudoalteromonas citrea]|uniref:Uncharacterized protein n=1 Tax=Pseudoalteromonas citrea TaxID=43655 RepID=A0A5S3XMS5_9GAMM|nr:hypothetical protein [Pseudoalteromonas citrea]TMP46557.1 hypothetical protein CWB97_01470 [Pseudoalteromonas citrea]TMP57495.1 hypothetical protein CWB96_13465 [Pseudoalteromonas citrea]